MKLKLKYVLCTLLVVSGIGSLVAMPVIGIIAIVLGTIANVYIFLQSEEVSRQQDYINEALSMLLIKKDLGNPYIDIFKKKLDQSSKVVDITFLIKGLKNQPNNIEAIEYLSAILAMKLSYDGWIGKKSHEFNIELSYLQKLIKKGLRLDSKRHVFYDALGIVYDIKGKHKKARQQFNKSKSLTKSPFGNLLIATSWQMEKKYNAAFKAMQLAQKEGAKGWLFEFYYGRALNAIGDKENGLIYIKSALRKNKMPMMIGELAELYYSDSKFLKGAKYNLVLGFMLIRSSPIAGIKAILLFFASLGIGCYSCISLTLWRLNRRFPKLYKLQRKFLPPDLIALSLGSNLLSDGKYKDAEKQLQFATEIISDRSESFVNLSTCFILQGKPEKAIEAIEHAIAIEPLNKSYMQMRENIAFGKIKKQKKQGHIPFLEKTGTHPIFLIIPDYRFF